MVCGHCHKEFDEKVQPLEYKKSGRFFLCPHCGLRYEALTFPKGYTQEKHENGSVTIKRAVSKIRMSKRDRIKIRRKMIAEALLSKASPEAIRQAENNLLPSKIAEAGGSPI